MFFSKQDWYHTDLWLFQDHISPFDNLITRGKSTLDGYDIMANNQNLYAEYEWHFHFRNLTVELYNHIKKSTYGGFSVWPRWRDEPQPWREAAPRRWPPGPQRSSDWDWTRERERERESAGLISHRCTLTLCFHASCLYKGLTYWPLAQDHSEQGVRTELRQQRQALLQLVVRVPLIGRVVQATFRVLEAVELGVLVQEVQLMFDLIEAEKTQKGKY